jgi:hypothetical protein
MPAQAKLRMHQTIGRANGRSELSPFGADATEVSGGVLDASHFDHRGGRSRGRGHSFKAQPTTHAAVRANGIAQELEALLPQVGEGSLSLRSYSARTQSPRGNFKMTIIHRKTAQPGGETWQAKPIILGRWERPGGIGRSNSRAGRLSKAQTTALKSFPYARLDSQPLLVMSGLECKTLPKSKAGPVAGAAKVVWGGNLLRRMLNESGITS